MPVAPVGIHGVPSNMDDDDGLLREVIRIIVDTMPTMVEDLVSAVAADDAEDLAIRARGLKGAAATVCAHAVEETAAKLEELSQHQDLEQAHPLLDELDARVRELRGFSVQNRGPSRN